MLRLRRYKRISVQNRRFRSNGGRLTQSSGRKGSPSNHSSSQKTRLNDLSYGVRIWTDLSSVLSQCTRVTDGRTNRRTDRTLIARPRLHSMQRGKNAVRLDQLYFAFTKTIQIFLSPSQCSLQSSPISMVTSAIGFIPIPTLMTSFILIFIVFPQ